MKKPEETRYYAVPPCPLSPNYNPLVPVPPLSVKKEVRPQTPPLNTVQAKAQAKAKAKAGGKGGYRDTNSTTSVNMTAEENTILREARKILLNRGQDLGALLGFNTTQHQTSQPSTPPQTEGRLPKREGTPLFQVPQGPNTMDSEDAVSEDFTVVDADFLAQMEDTQIIEQLRQLEVATNMLQLTLQNRATSSQGR